MGRVGRSPEGFRFLTVARSVSQEAAPPMSYNRPLYVAALSWLAMLPVKAVRWLAEEAWEKINLAATWRELKELGRKHGTRFFVAAVIWELVEDVLFPFLSWKFGHPELIPVFLVLHFEPVVYPVFFKAFRTWDRIQGREPWDPPRLGKSTLWRAGLKELSYRAVSLAAFLLLLAGLGMPTSILTFYMLGMTMFSIVHDRLWHDSNYGIDVPTDTVQPKRVVAKVLTYRAVSVLVMSGVFYGLLGTIPGEVWGYQASMLVLHTALSAWWSRSTIGIRPVVQRAGDAG